MARQICTHSTFTRKRRGTAAYAGTNLLKYQRGGRQQIKRGPKTVMLEKT